MFLKFHKIQTTIPVSESLHISLFHKAWAELINAESSHWRCSVKKGVLKNLANFTGRKLCWSLFLIKFQQIKSATLLIFCYEICESFKNTYFEEHQPADASIIERQQKTHALLGKKNKSCLVNPVLYPDVFSYR